MNQIFKLVLVEHKYTDYLVQFDRKVPYNNGIKKNIPFIGVLFQVENFTYFAPLSSPRKKHLQMRNTLDFEKIEGGTLGAINYNNMIPIPKEAYTIIDLKNNSLQFEAKYYELLKNQYYSLLKNKTKIQNKGYKLYKLYKNGKLNKNIKTRCCNFVLLEEKSKIYTNGKTKEGITT